MGLYNFVFIFNNELMTILFLIRNEQELFKEKIVLFIFMLQRQITDI